MADTPPAPRYSKYPAQIVLMVSTDVADLLTHIANEQGLYKTEVARSFLHAGIRKAGYTDIATIQPRGTDTINLGPQPTTTENNGHDS